MNAFAPDAGQWRIIIMRGPTEVGIGAGCRMLISHKDADAIKDAETWAASAVANDDFQYNHHNNQAAQGSTEAGWIEVEFDASGGSVDGSWLGVFIVAARGPTGG